SNGTGEPVKFFDAATEQTGRLAAYFGQGETGHGSPVSEVCATVFGADLREAPGRKQNHDYSHCGTNYPASDYLDVDVHLGSLDVESYEPALDEQFCIREGFEEVKGVKALRIPSDILRDIRTPLPEPVTGNRLECRIQQTLVQLAMGH
uniref:hypothetical protein n=1 Tax=Streptomyces sp. NRRL S-15 TaxID=1463886 RepID=UPI0005B405E6